MNRTNWAEWISYPSWVCPACQKGQLRLIPGSTRSIESLKERRSRDSDHYNHDEHLERFTGHLQCDHRGCAETATFAGDIHTHRFPDNHGGDYTDTSYRPFSIIPAPLPFPLHPKTPATVSALVRQAAALFWLDQDAAANRIREAIQAILSDLGVGVTGPKGNRLHLHARIELFRSADAGKWLEQAEIIEAVKWIGNQGTHETISREAALDAFEMLETVIEDIYVRSRHALLEKVRSTNTRSRRQPGG